MVVEGVREPAVAYSDGEGRGGERGCGHAQTLWMEESERDG